MAPAQALTGIDEERKPDIVVKSEAEEANGEKVMLSDATGLVCINNFEDNGFYAESSCMLKKVDDSMDQEVEIVDCDDGFGIEKVKAEDPDATDYSSSFGGTLSGSDNGSKIKQGDVEVDSVFGLMNYDPAVLDGFNRVFKKKKVTAHWRKFISPLMWRCQWLELQIKELRLQSLKYDKELSAYQHEKELKMVELDGSVSRSVPLTARSSKKQIMKRRKRKRNEDIADISSYMSNHHIFSYYENKKTETDGHSVEDDCGEQDENVRGTGDIDWLLGIKGRDSSLEQILLNIEAVQSRVLKLKTHLNKVMCRNATEISSYPGNLFPGDPPPSYTQSHSDSPRNKDGLPVGATGTPPHHESEYEIQDMVMPGSAVSSYGDAADVDIIESTIGLLSAAADGSLNQRQITDLYEDSDDDILIDNQAAEDEFQNFEKVNQRRENPTELVKEEAESPSEEESIAPNVSNPGPGPETENVVMPQQTALKPCYSGKRRGRKPKRKRQGGSIAALNNLSERLQKRRISGRKS